MRQCITATVLALVIVGTAATQTIPPRAVGGDGTTTKIEMPSFIGGKIKIETTGSKGLGSEAIQFAEKTEERYKWLIAQGFKPFAADKVARQKVVFLEVPTYYPVREYVVIERYIPVAPPAYTYAYYGWYRGTYGYWGYGPYGWGRYYP